MNIEPILKAKAIDKMFHIYYEKALENLEQYCIHYKIIGGKGETPRYSQLFIEEREDGKFVLQLQSTITNIFYNVCDFNHEYDDVHFFRKNSWDTWKKIRTKYLIKNHPTIDPY